MPVSSMAGYGHPGGALAYMGMPDPLHSPYTHEGIAYLTTRWGRSSTNAPASYLLGPLTAALQQIVDADGSQQAGVHY